MQTTAALRALQLPARCAVRTACSSKRATIRCAKVGALGTGCTLPAPAAGGERAGPWSG